MRKFSPEVSFLNKTKISISNVVLGEELSHFKNTFSLKEKILQKILETTNGTVLAIENERPHAIISLLEKLKKEGFVTHYGEGALFSDYPKFNFAGIFYSSKKEVPEDIYQRAWGYTYTNEKSEVAFSKALGEFVERRVSFYIKDSFRGNVNYGDASFLYEHVPKFTQRQIARYYGIVSSAEDMRKMLGFFAKSITGDKKRFIPLDGFYWRSLSATKDKIFMHPTTSGSGGGATKTDAILSGIYELVERDLFLLYWLSGIQPNKIKNQTIPEPFGTYVRSCEADYNIEVHFLEMKYDIERVGSACVIIDPVLNLITAGARVGTDGIQVLKDSFLEALAVLSIVRMRRKGFDASTLQKVLEKPPFTSEIDHRDRVNLYSSEYGIKIIRNTFLEGESIDFAQFNKSAQIFSTKENELENILNQFKTLVLQKGAGYHIYLHEFESEWLDYLDYHAVHVFVPSFMKLYLRENLATPLSKRLTEFANAHGKMIQSEADLNPLPHFFP